jgi:hypothetical protein
MQAGEASDVLRIHGELLKLGFDIGETSVGNYMVRRRTPSSQSWRPFLENHLNLVRLPDPRRAGDIRRDERHCAHGRREESFVSHGFLFTTLVHSFTIDRRASNEDMAMGVCRGFSDWRCGWPRESGGLAQPLGRWRICRRTL